MIFYFSGTGNSRWLASRIAQATGEELVNIAQGEAVYALKPGERLGFVFPVYGWDLPPIVRSFIRRLDLGGCPPAYLYFACTCGDDTGRTLQRFRREASRHGWHLSSAFALQMPNTYVCLPGFDVDAPAVRDRKLHEAPSAADVICQAVVMKKAGVFDVRPGALPRIKTYMLGGFFRRFLMSDKAFRASDACNACGLCARVCPMKDIIVTDRPQWQGHCTTCLSCYHHCPRHAITHGRSSKGKGQYQFPT